MKKALNPMGWWTYVLVSCLACGVISTPTFLGENWARSKAPQPPAGKVYYMYILGNGYYDEYDVLGILVIGKSVYW